MKAQFTKVYKTNRHLLTPEERKEFVKELQKVIGYAKCEYRDRGDLLKDFIWMQSPQDLGYWRNWHNTFINRNAISPKG